MSAVGALLTLVGIAFILYVYAGYPLLLAALARLRRPSRGARPARGAPPARRAGDRFEPAVTVLIAAYDEEAVIGAKLEDTLALEYPAGLLQILVAVDGSEDRTGEIAAGFADRGVEVVRSAERRGKMASIAHAMGHVRGDIVVFSDANNHFSPNALRELTRPFADPTVGAVGGAKVILRGDGELGDSEGLYWRYESAIKANESRLGSTVGVAGEVLALRTELFRPPPAGIINDDFWMATDVLLRGLRVVYAPGARSSERISPTLGDEMARRSRIAAGRLQALTLIGPRLPWRRPLLLWMLLSHKFARPFVPIAMVVAALGTVLWLVGAAGAGAGRALAWALAAAAAQALAYLLAAVGGTKVLPGALGRVAYLARFLVAANVAALLGMLRFASGRQSALWRRVARRAEGA